MKTYDQWISEVQANIQEFAEFDKVLADVLEFPNAWVPAEFKDLRNCDETVLLARVIKKLNKKIGRKKDLRAITVKFPNDIPDGDENPVRLNVLNCYRAQFEANPEAELKPIDGDDMKLTRNMIAFCDLMVENEILEESDFE